MLDRELGARRLEASVDSGEESKSFSHWQKKATENRATNGIYYFIPGTLDTCSCHVYSWNQIWNGGQLFRYRAFEFVVSQVEDLKER
ncbi:hypothetical protein Leryth_026325 [Lithospermum erythrorhizon]|nr:hypothetical protein Leryth_026325 [Lithospermum erythrorhizon]